MQKEFFPGLSLEELSHKITYREYRLRLEWLDYNQEQPDAEAFYLAQIAQQIKLNCGHRSSSLGEFLNPFKQSKAVKPSSPDELDVYAKARQAHLIKAAKERDKPDADSE